MNHQRYINYLCFAGGGRVVYTLHKYQNIFFVSFPYKPRGDNKVVVRDEHESEGVIISSFCAMHLVIRCLRLRDKKKEEQYLYWVGKNFQP